MKVTLSSIFVNDQTRARDFCTTTLGFVVKTDLPVGEYSWLTVVSPEGVAGVELVLEPAAHAAAREFQQALLPRDIECIGAEPERVAPGTELSPALTVAAARVASMLADSWQTSY